MDSNRKMTGKVELTKLDMQNYLVNGSLSKQFIHQNKKELQKFIKKKTKSGSDFFRGYESVEGPRDGNVDINILSPQNSGYGNEQYNQ